MKEIKIIKVYSYKEDGNGLMVLEDLLKEGWSITSNTYCWHLNKYYPYTLFTLERNKR